MNPHLLVTASGEDKPGIMAKLIKTLAKNGVEISDMGQSVTHKLLSLSIVISLGRNSSTNQNQLLKDLLFEGKQLDLQIDFQIIEKKKSLNPSDFYILNCVAIGNLKAKFIFDISESLYKFSVNIERIDNLSKKGFRSLEIVMNIPAKVNIFKLKQAIYLISHDYQVDAALIKDNIYRRNKRLICFDMDSTLIQTEVIDEMAKAMNVGEKVKIITEKAMNGELDFNESLLKRVSALKGLTIEQMNKIARNLPLTDGVEEFISTVKAVGYKIAIVSGGFTFFANHLKRKLKLDYIFANELEIKDKALTGRIIGEIINSEKKAEYLVETAKKEGILEEQVVAIGDGANDLIMLSKAGLGIAYHAKEIVKKKAGNHISFGPMSNILYFLGLQPSK